MTEWRNSAIEQAIVVRGFGLLGWLQFGTVAMTGAGAWSSRPAPTSQWVQRAEARHRPLTRRSRAPRWHPAQPYARAESSRPPGGSWVGHSSVAGRGWADAVRDRTRGPGGHGRTPVPRPSTRRRRSPPTAVPCRRSPGRSPKTAAGRRSARLGRVFGEVHQVQHHVAAGAGAGPGGRAEARFRTSRPSCRRKVWPDRLDLAGGGVGRFGERHGEARAVLDVPSGPREAGSTQATSASPSEATRASPRPGQADAIKGGGHEPLGPGLVHAQAQLARRP
jgi:hypothetical protein